MSIMRMATIPANICPAPRTAPLVRTPSQARRLEKPRSPRRPKVAWWSILLTEAYPAIGLMLIVGYLAWILLLGEHTLPWAGNIAPAE